MTKPKQPDPPHDLAPVEYWTMWGDHVLCSSHDTLRGALKDADHCEARGGAPHRFYRVQWVRLGQALPSRRRTP